MYTINIGLRTSARYGSPERNIPYDTVREAIVKRLGAVTRSALAMSAHTEVTLVVVLPGRADADAVFELARDLSQDCIAVLDYDGRGSLVGPYHEAWGEFNPAYFHAI